MFICNIHHRIRHSDDRRINFLLAVMAKLKLLDLCCKAGGCSTGYYRAAKALKRSIEIVGVDIDDQPNYPFEFVKGDAVEYLMNNYQFFNRIHASPPCQKYTQATAAHRAKGKEYRDILDPLRRELKTSLIPTVIENVMAAPIRNDIVLRGDMFNLKVLRSRKFELMHWFMLNPMIPKKIGSVKEGDFAQVVGNGQLKPNRAEHVKIEGSVHEVWSEAMGIDWMTTEELREAIPPAYTEFIGMEFLHKKWDLKL